MIIASANDNDGKARSVELTKPGATFLRFVHEGLRYGIVITRVVKQPRDFGPPYDVKLVALCPNPRCPQAKTAHPAPGQGVIRGKQRPAFIRGVHSAAKSLSD